MVVRGGGGGGYIPYNRHCPVRPCRSPRAAVVGASCPVSPSLGSGRHHGDARAAIVSERVRTFYGRRTRHLGCLRGFRPTDNTTGLRPSVRVTFPSSLSRGVMHYTPVLCGMYTGPDRPPSPTMHNREGWPPRAKNADDNRRSIAKPINSVYSVRPPPIGLYNRLDSNGTRSLIERKRRRKYF